MPNNDQLKTAVELALSTLRAYQGILKANGNVPFAIPDWVITVLEEALKAQE
jgi:hypothetical protein